MPKSVLRYSVDKVRQESESEICFVCVCKRERKRERKDGIKTVKLHILVIYPNPPRGTDLGTLVVLFQSGKE